ncbi:hypothetical protein AC1031_010180 [Aphanomyces cochlioides]|nr:hypothetical protein AC1031_010180 [Aphanomyces cochlioides]
MSAVIKSNKNYLADKKAFLAHFHAQALLLTVFKAGVLHGAIVLNNYVESIDVDEDVDDDADDLKPKEEKPAFVAPTPSEFVIKVQHTSVRMVSNTTMLRSLEFVSLQVFDVRTASKLLKDTTKSAVRKYARFGSSTVAAIRITKTAFRASMLSNTAAFLVEEIIDFVKTFFNLSKKEESKFIERLLLAARKCFQAIVGTAVGSAVGTFISPGKGTFVGAFVGETIGYSL